MSSDFTAAAKRVNDLQDDLKDSIDDEVDGAMGETEGGLKQTLIRNESVASGELHDETEKVQLEADDPDTITNVGIRSAPHWEYVEHGTGIKGDSGIPSPDGAAPPSKIQSWIDDKGIVGTYYDHRGSVMAPSELAWVIAFRIAKTGTMPHPFVRPTWHASTVGEDNVINRAKLGMKTAVSRF